MLGKLIWNDIKQNRLLSAATIFFMTISAMLLALTVLLFAGLLGAIDDLMGKAQVPDFMQMHTGEIEESKLLQFVENHGEISKWQICRFLNLENSRIVLGSHNLADSTQDNGLAIQGEGFDYLLGMENEIPEVSQGEVYVPVCYRSLYSLNVGDTMKIGSEELVIAGFIRDAQMNSMMSSSKRFLVNEADYNDIKTQGEEEYLIEFLLCDRADENALQTDYTADGLPSNGPAITKPLIRMINALSDGIMILVIFLVSIVVLLIALICIRFILSLRMEKDRKEIGMLKALGIEKREIKKLYFAKYILFSVCGALLGLMAAALLQRPLSEQIQELYGVADADIGTGLLSLLAVLLVEGIILFSVWRCLKKTDSLSALEALIPEQAKEKDWGQYLLIGVVAGACVFLMIVPQNLYSTLSSPKFVTYMGIGDGEIRIDIRQTEDIAKATEQIASALENDPQVEKYVVLQTKSYPVMKQDGEKFNFILETGNHNLFPVSYVSGTFPGKENEIALSALNAKELGLRVGDTLELLIDGRETTYTVCGIYSDITNGGKTAKAAAIEDDTPITWSVLYVSLKDSVSKGQWITQYRQAGADVTDITDYVRNTYGQTLEQLHVAALVAVGISVMVIFVVVALFMRLLVEKKRYEISFHKALGFTNSEMRYAYLAKGLFPAAAGVIAGVAAGNLCGESLCGTILKSFGAEGFRFVIAWERVLFVVPVIALSAAAVAILTGISEIRRIKAYECCIGKE